MKLNKTQCETVINRLRDEIVISGRKEREVYENAILTNKRLERQNLKDLSDFSVNMEEKNIEDIKEFIDEQGYAGIRFCEKCGKPIIEGYSDEGDAYCSLDCLGMSYDEFMEQYSDEQDCVFWTEWEI